MVCGVLLLLLLKILGMFMNDRLWRGWRCVVGSRRIDCRSVDVDGYGHVIEADLEVEA